MSDDESLEILAIEHQITDEIFKISILIKELEKRADVQLLPVYFNMTLLVASLIEATEQVSRKLQIRNEVGDLLRSLQKRKDS